MDFVAKKINSLRGEIEIPSDKSLSHRAIIFSTLAKGKSVIKNFSKGKDPGFPPVNSFIRTCRQVRIR